MTSRKERIKKALTDEWRTSAQIGEAAGISARSASNYLRGMDCAERREAEADRREGSHYRVMEWRRKQEGGDSGSAGQPE